MRPPRRPVWTRRSRRRNASEGEAAQKAAGEEVVSTFLRGFRARRFHRRKTLRKVLDSTPQLVSDRLQLVHRLARRPRNRPVFGLVPRADRASVQASERHDPGRAGDEIRSREPRRLRPQRDADLPEEFDYDRVDRRRGLHPRALPGPTRWRDPVEHRFRQDASERVLDADEEDHRHRSERSDRGGYRFGPRSPITTRQPSYNEAFVLAPWL